MEAQTVQPTVDPFDAAITTDSTYVEPPPTVAPPRAPDGTFAKVEDAEPVADAVPEKPVEKPPEKKPRNDPQARIDQAIARQREAERRANEAERRAREAEARTQKPAEPAKAAEPEKFPDYATYLQTHPNAPLEEWLDARDQWRDEKREAATKRAAQDAKADADFQRRLSPFQTRYAEADDETRNRIDPALLGVRPYSALTESDKELIRRIPDPRERDLVAFRCFLADQWLDADHPIELLAALSDPDTFQRFATLPPGSVARELAKLDAGFGAASRKDASGSAPEPKPASKAHAPIKPLGTAPRVPDDEESADEPFEKFFQRENAKDRKAGRL